RVRGRPWVVAPRERALRPACWVERCGCFPFEFVRQALAGPPRERLGLVIADMAHGASWIDGAGPVEHAGRPRRSVARPVFRGDGGVRRPPGPAGVGPELASLVTAVFQELDVLAVHDGR